MKNQSIQTSKSEPTRSMTRFGLILTAVLATAPFALMTLVHLLSLRAAMLLGHWPLVSIDDPKYIIENDFLYTALGYAICVPLCALIASLPLTPVLLFWGRKRFKFGIRCTLTLLFAIGWIWLFSDPLRRMAWWID